MKKTDIKKLCMGCMKEKPSASCVCPHCGFDEKEYAESHSEALPLRTVLENKYIIGKQLGNGGFGKTYVAYDMNIGQKMCIKEIFPVQLVRRNADNSVSALQGYEGEFENYIEKAHDEALRLSEFNELPGVVSVRDYFEDNGTAYIVMDFVEGKTLREYLQENDGVLPVEWVLEAFKPLLETLAHIHSKNVIHRDISPDNMILSDEGTLTLIDFGAAREYSAETNNSLSVIIKHGYAPIEQYSRSGKQGPWTDIYALAATIYRMITGKVLEDATDRVTQDGTPFDRLNAIFDEKIIEALTMALAVDYNQRYQLVRDFYKVLYGEEMPNAFNIDEMCEMAAEFVNNGDIGNAFRWYKRSAQYGNSEGMFQIACMYEDGRGVQQSYEDAIKWHKQAAKLGVCASMVELGYFYGFGKGTEKDITEALQWCKKAAKNGEQCGYLLYIFLCNETKQLVLKNDGVFAQYEKDNIHNISQDDLLVCIGNCLYGRKRKYYELAVERGNAEAMAGLGAMFENGDRAAGVVVDLERSFAWYKKSAEMGNVHGMLGLANMYECDKGLPYDFGLNDGWYDDILFEYDELPQKDKEALFWYEQAEMAGDNSAKELHANLLYKIGEHYMYSVIFPDEANALKYFEKAADRGHPDAMCMVGRIYETSEEIEKDVAQACYWYKKAAECGNVWGMSLIGSMYKRGKGVEQNYDKALAWYGKAADADPKYRSSLADTLFEIGEKYYEGTDNIKIDYSIARKYFEQAASKGSTDAMCRLGNICNYGEGVDKNYETAFQWYKKAAETGNAWGMRCMGYMFEYGKGIGQDFEEAIYWYKKAVEGGDTIAGKRQADLSCKIGEQYFNGTSEIEKNYICAERYFEEAADKGNTNAMCYMGNICEKKYWRDRYLDPKPLEEAFKWYKKAAEHGSAWGMRCFAIMYENADIEEQDDNKALYWYEKAETAGDLGAKELHGNLLYKIGAKYYKDADYSKAKEYLERAIDKGNTYAMCRLGEMYDNGLGVRLNSKCARKWYKKAAKLGNGWGMRCLAAEFEFEAISVRGYQKALSWYEKACAAGDGHAKVLYADLLYRLGERYYNGICMVKQDYVKAKKYFEKAAEKGCAKAMCRLGNIYEFARGVEKQIETALAWYEKAAENESVQAMRCLANMYKCGNGVERDNERALAWYKKAIAKGDIRALVLYQDLLYRTTGALYIGIDDGQQDLCKTQKDFEWVEEELLTEGVENMEEALPVYKDLETINDEDTKEYIKEIKNNLVYMLGEKYHYGTAGTEPNNVKAMEYFEKVAYEGNTYAMYCLGRIYRVGGDGIKGNLNEALVWFKKAAEGGNALAAETLGDMFRRGFEIEQNYEQAVYWFEKAMAGGRFIYGYEDDLYELAKEYYEGTEEKARDFVKAKKYFERAADNGKIAAMRYLGDIYRFGVGIEKNFEEAFAWYEKAAQSEDLSGMCSLAYMYSRGEGIVQDFDEALYWYQRAADAGATEGMCGLGDCYRYGHGVEKDYQEALRWYKQAANLGSALGMCNVGMMYEEGKGTDQDYEEALCWYKKAALADESLADRYYGDLLYKIGEEYYNRIDKNYAYAKARGYFEQAAEAGNVKAMCRLGHIYEFGEGVEKDIEKAFTWYKKSAEHNDS